MPTNTFWRPGLLFPNVSAILILLFHRLRALPVGSTLFTRSQVKSSQVKSSRVSPNALRRTLPGHSNNISSPHSSLDGKIRALATHAAKRLQCPKQHWEKKLEMICWYQAWFTEGTQLKTISFGYNISISPKQFSFVFEVALEKSPELGDGGIPLDLWFADDILLFTTSSDAAARWWMHW